MHVFKKCGALERSYDQACVDSKKQEIRAEYLELKRKGKMANRRKQEIQNFKVLAAFWGNICSVGDAITLLQAKLQQKYMFWISI